MGNDIQYDVFLAFASSDEEIARPIWKKLSSDGLRVFWSDDALKQKPGESWVESIQAALESSRHFILIASESSISSKWVKREYEAFYDQFYSPVRRLIPILTPGYDASKLPAFLKQLQTARLDEPDCLEEIIPLLRETSLEDLKKQLIVQREEVKKLEGKVGVLQEENRKLREQQFDPGEAASSDVARKPEFYQWLRKRRLLLIIAVLATVFQAALAISSLSSSYRVPGIGVIQGKVFHFLTYALHALVITVFLWVAARIHVHKIPSKYPAATAAAQRFYGNWVFLWIMWLSFYFALTARHLLTAVGINDKAWFWEPLLNFSNNLQTVFILICFLALAAWTGVKDPPDLRPHVWAAFGLLTVINVLVVAVTYLKYPQVATGVEIIFRFLSGLPAGISLALLVGRFESRFIGVPGGVLTALYLYALIQLVYPLARFDEYPHVLAIITSVSLPLKLLFFAFVAWLLGSGKMLFYLEKVGELDRGAERQWQRFKRQEFGEEAGQAIGAR